MVAYLFRSRAALEAEVLTLRQQINILRRTAPKKQTFSATGELKIEVRALTHPEVGETTQVGAAKFALWTFAGPERTAA
jgi:hypothetical protein